LSLAAPSDKSTHARGGFKAFISGRLHGAICKKTFAKVEKQK
jgi:hypothetical protein